MFKISAPIALILFATYAFAQEASSDSSGNAGANARGGSAVVSGAQSTTVIESATEMDYSEAFALPGGYGAAPLNFTPGQGHFNRPAVEFSTTLQHGYDDNIFCSGDSGDPRQGSMITTLTEGVDLLFSQDRLGFSLGGNVGAQYYWDREDEQLFPTGGIDAIFAYKLSPQTQLSVQVSAAYLTQPAFSVFTGLTDANGKGYFSGNAKIDLLHRWTPLFSTNTTYLAYGTYYSDSSFENSNHISQTVGESFRYALNPNLTGVFEGRIGEDVYDGDGRNAQNYYALVGWDTTLSRRLSSSIRLGSQTRTPDDGSTQTMPYGEASVNYTLTRTTLLGWQLRYGYEDTNSARGSSKSLRTGILLTQSITSRLRGNIGLNVCNTDALHDDAGTVLNSYSSISATVGLNYAYSKDLALFANYSRIDKNSPSDNIAYTKNVYYVGATLRY